MHMFKCMCVCVHVKCTRAQKHICSEKAKEELYIYISIPSQFPLFFRYHGRNGGSLCNHFQRISFFFFLSFVFLGQHPWQMEVPRLGVESDLQLPAYTTAMMDSIHICDLHRSSRQRWTLSPLSEARGGTRILMDTSWVC